QALVGAEGVAGAAQRAAGRDHRRPAQGVGEGTVQLVIVNQVAGRAGDAVVNNAEAGQSRVERDVQGSVGAQRNGTVPQLVVGKDGQGPVVEGRVAGAVQLELLAPDAQAPRDAAVELRDGSAQL